MTSSFESVCDALDAARLEVDRLRAEVERLRTPWRVQLDSYRAENNRLRALNAELVEALQKIVDLQDRMISGEGLFTRAITIARAILAKAKEQS